MRTGKYWIRCLWMMLVGLCAPLGPVLAQAPVSPAEAAARDLAQQRQALLGAAASFGQRQEAARRLVQRSTPEARQIITDILRAAGNVESVEALAVALSSDPSPDAALVPLLANLVGLKPSVTEAAAQALAHYATRGVDSAWQVLEQRSALSNMDSMARAALLRGMGRFVDKRSAQVLVDIMRDPLNDDPVRMAAADALVEMGGLRKLSRDFVRLEAWWRQNRGRPDAELKAEMNARRAEALQSREQELRQIKDELYPIFQRALDKATDVQGRAEVLDPLLGSGADHLRVIGARLVGESFQKGKAMPPAVVQRLRAMVGDSATDVRAAVIRTLSDLNDKDASAALLAQFEQEQDAVVREAIAAALGSMGNIQAVGPLMAALNDESTHVVEAAAGSLKTLGKMLRQSKDAGERAIIPRLAEALRQRWRSADRGSTLRPRLVEAAAYLGSPLLRDDFAALLAGRAETPLVRQFAVTGIGEIGDSDAANLVAPLVRDPANTVRKAAAGAMQKVGAFAHIDGLLISLNPTVEPDPSVRQAVWDAIKTLAERGTPKALVDIAGRFMRGGPLPDPERRREILLMIEQKYEQQRPASADEAAQREEQLAITRQNLGETLLEMRGDSARQREQAAAAADYFRKARVHWESVRAAENVLLWAVQQEMRALLAAQKYKETIDLADAQLRRDPRLGDDMGRLLDAEVRRLRERKDYKPALALLDEAERVGPALRSYAELFKKVREDILRDQKDGGMLWPLRPMRLAGAQPRWLVIDG